MLLTAAGCFWPAPGQGPNRQAHNDLESIIGTDTVADLGLAWEARVDEGAAGDPVTSIRGVHVNDARSVYGFARASGARLWEHGVAAPDTMGQPFVLGDRLYANAILPYGAAWQHGGRFELDPATGAVLAGPVQGRVAAHRGSLQLGYDDLPEPRFGFWFRTVRVHDTATGETLCCTGWYDIVGRSQLGDVPFTLGSNMVLDAGQGILADLPPGQPGVGGNGVRAFLFDADARCQAEPNYLCPNWATPLDGTTATVPVLSSDEATAYVGTDAGTVYAVDTATGAVRWSAAVGSAVTDAPALAHGSLFVPTASGGLVAVAADGCGAATCGPLWSATTGSRVTQQPAVAGGVVFAGSADGSLHAFDAAGCGAAACPALWSASTGSEITGAPAVSQGRLFAGTADGRLVAYELSGGAS